MEKKKYQGREKGKKGQLAERGGGQRNKGWEREWGRERKAEKTCKRKHNDSKEKKRRGTGIWTVMEKNAERTEEKRQEEQQGAGQRRKDQDSGRMETEKEHLGWSTGQKGIGVWAGSGTKE